MYLSHHLERTNRYVRTYARTCTGPYPNCRRQLSGRVVDTQPAFSMRALNTKRTRRPFHLGKELTPLREAAEEPLLHCWSHCPRACFLHRHKILMCEAFVNSSVEQCVCPCVEQCPLVWSSVCVPQCGAVCVSPCVEQCVCPPVWSSVPLCGAVCVSPSVEQCVCPPVWSSVCVPQCGAVCVSHSVERVENFFNMKKMERVETLLTLWKRYCYVPRPLPAHVGTPHLLRVMCRKRTT